MSTKALIIPAAGIGSRMKKDVPKPFLLLNGITILEWTLQPFLKLGGVQQVIVPTSEAYVEMVQDLLREHLPDSVKAQSIVGGAERQFSIALALEQVGDVDLVMVHDAVRPFVRLSSIEQCCESAEQAGAAIVAIPAKSTIKNVNAKKEVVETPSRNTLWEAQTPQIFKKALIKKAYDQAAKDDFTGTDDASLVERLDATVRVVEGSQQNFKITYPLDLTIAEQLIKQQKV